MGIQNIQILITEQAFSRSQHAQVAIAKRRIAEHRTGLHTYGNMRRDCPLCQGR